MDDTLEIKCPSDPMDIKRIVFNGEEVSAIGVKSIVFRALPDMAPVLSVEYIRADKG